MEFWTAAAIAAVFGTITSAIISIWGVSRNIKHKSVVEERQKWRDTLRGLIPELISQVDDEARKKIRNSIALRLNPYQDGECIRQIDDFIANPAPELADAIVTRFQDLLKRDWERAKIEAGFWPRRARERADARVDAQRALALESDQTTLRTHA
ncbi:MAG: hypothetical protein ACTHNQ_05050 [Microbacterium sp.]|uniref:hypothetical protein n=1 Tax=Microbacterium sp. TaxID=51671 RepID=UPI003F7E5FA0